VVMGTWKRFFTPSRIGWDADELKGNLRIDANISVHRSNTPYGTRSEIKNLNSIRFLQTAVTYEIRRHIAHYESTSLPLLQETRQVNELTGETYSLRTKEEAMDYRYLPDSNLPSLVLKSGTLKALRDGLPEMPWMTVERLKGMYEGLEDRDVETMIQMDEYHGKGVGYFEEMMSGLDLGKGKKAVNWLTHEVLGQLGKADQEWNEEIIPANVLGEIVGKVEGGEMSGTTGKAVVRYLINNYDQPNQGRGTLDLGKILDKMGLKQDKASNGDLQDMCKKAIEKCKKEAEMVRKGNEKVAMRLVGEVMKISKGQADPKKAREIILQILQKVS
jgi:aspartyl-tRNA(Asn)/glutamyl-tRNA(Gln) amidotransferase subunit B